MWGSVAVTFSVSANTVQTSRVGTLTVAGQAVTVTQAGSGTGGTPLLPPTNLRLVR